MKYKSFFLTLFLLLVIFVQLGCSLPVTDQNWAAPYSPEESHRSFKKESRYVTMRDGVKIAVTSYIPTSPKVSLKTVSLKKSETFPAILWQTRYYRDFDIRFPFSLLSSSPGSTFELFLKHGYVIIETDVRGSGASFGHQDAPWSPAEVEDGKEIVDWIIKQPWSNGIVGTTGVSYVGTSAEMLLTKNHPAVKAAIIRYSLFDCYTDIGFPGGIHNEWFTKAWGDGNRILDQQKLSELGWFETLALRGSMPVDEDKDRSRLHSAVQDHFQNHDVHEDALHLTYRDDQTKRNLTFNQFCPSGFIPELMKSTIPIYSMSGWYDGGYAHSALERYQLLSKRSAARNKDRVLIGPWDHGGRQNISPYSPSSKVEFNHGEEMLRFFDQYLKGNNTGINEDAPVRVFILGSEKWVGLETWPAPTTATFLYPQENNQLLETSCDKKITSCLKEYQEQESKTGDHVRWNSPYNPKFERIIYENRDEEDKLLLTFDSEKLENDKTILGDILFTTSISSSENDGTIFVYLEDVTPSGEVFHVTEGELRLLHRKEAVAESYLHSFLKADGQEMIPGKFETLKIKSLPAGYTFKQGHKIRVAIAGRDVSHFAKITKGQTKYTFDLSKTVIEFPMFKMK
jgi:uncharacterized protein